jgi:hypothetical protein
MCVHESGNKGVEIRWLDLKCSQKLNEDGKDFPGIQAFV